MKDPFALPAAEVLKQSGVDQHLGLSSSEVKKRLAQFGFNRIEQDKSDPWWKLLFDQFKSPLVLLLLVATGLSFFFKEWLDGFAIIVVILVNAAIGFSMEFQAGQSMKALKKLAAITSKVKRDSQTLQINAEEIVPGDLVFLEPGDLVPADLRIYHHAHLQADESSLTGESAPVNKTDSVLPGETLLADRKNMLFNGTFITKGNAWGVVIATGVNTELGKISSLVQSASQAATPLEKKLEELSNQLIKITVALVVIIFFSGWLAGRDVFLMLKTSIALAVAAIPEGLPIVATIALANGMIKMAKQQVIVKRLSAVETLGGTTIICTDKTGTLTENRMTVERALAPGQQPNDTINPRITAAAILCNTAELDNKGNEIGDSLETALLKSVEPFSLIEETRKKFPKINEEPFSSETKRMATAHQSGNQVLVYAKGAAEEIIRLCQSHAENDKNTALSADAKKKLLHEAETMASKGYKVIAFAYADHTQAPPDLFSNLIFLGFVCLIDPPRKDAKQAIKECRSAGINVVMVTGDQPATAKEIARQLGMEVHADQAAVAGAQMKPYDDLSETDRDVWLNANVFARVSPAQKLDLVRVFQDAKFVVAMTGDGVNDAPALKKADIGIAMGLRGTQVAQEVADMVIKDDSFVSIVAAIRQGRVIFENIRKFVIYLLSCNLSELLIIATASILNLHFQLYPLQILYINILTDVIPALALGMTEGNPSIMNHHPRNKNEAIIDKDRWKAIFSYSLIITLSCMAAVFLGHEISHQSGIIERDDCNNILFFSLIGTQLLHTLNMNSGKGKFFRSEVVRNKFVWLAIAICIILLVISAEIPTIKEVLDITSVSLTDFLLIAGSSVFSLLLIQLTKRLGWVKQ
jgi:Ca2+-transporting ATPase